MYFNQIYSYKNFYTINDKKYSWRKFKLTSFNNLHSDLNVCIELWRIGNFSEKQIFYIKDFKNDHQRYTFKSFLKAPNISFGIFSLIICEVDSELRLHIKYVQSWRKYIYISVTHWEIRFCGKRKIAKSKLFMRVSVYYESTINREI